MSRPTKRLEIDFSTLRKDATAAIPLDPATQANEWLFEKLRVEAWIDALMKAIEQRKPATLLAMLDNKVPISSELLPALANVLRMYRQGALTGRGALLNSNDKLGAQKTIEQLAQRPGWSKERARAAVAENLGVSEETLKSSRLRR